MLQAIAYLVGGTNVLVVAYLSSFGILFISTISVFAFMLPKLWAFKYPKVVPEAYNTAGGGTMAGHGSMHDGSNNSANDDESEELAEAKRDMSEMREQLAELRQSNKELKAEVEAAGRVP